LGRKGKWEYFLGVYRGYHQAEGKEFNAEGTENERDREKREAGKKTEAKRRDPEFRKWRK